VVESVKAASDVYAPVAGEVTAVNEALKDAPETLNADAFAAWLWKMKPAGDLSGLMNAEAYKQNIAAQK
jgi:glycine cleavage system H protein